MAAIMAAAAIVALVGLRAAVRTDSETIAVDTELVASED